MNGASCSGARRFARAEYSKSAALNSRGGGIDGRVGGRFNSGRAGRGRHCVHSGIAGRRPSPPPAA